MNISTQLIYTKVSSSRVCMVMYLLQFLKSYRHAFVLAFGSTLYLDIQHRRRRRRRCW